MKLAFTIFFTFLFSVKAYENCVPSVYLISSYDDVFVKKESGAFSDYLSSPTPRKSYLDFFVSHMIQNYAPIEVCELINGPYWTLLTSKNSFFSRRVKDHLEYHQAAHSKIVMKPLLVDHIAFKKKEVLRLSKMVNVPLIIIGSIAEKDHLAYLELAENNNIEVIYLYGDYSKKSAKVVPFSTPFDIAYNEYLQSRMNLESVINIGREVLDENIATHLSPLFNCSSFLTENHQSLKNKNLTEISHKIHLRVRGWCQR